MMCSHVFLGPQVGGFCPSKLERINVHLLVFSNGLLDSSLTRALFPVVLILVFVLVLKDSLRTNFKSFSLSLSL